MESPEEYLNRICNNKTPKPKKPKKAKTENLPIFGYAWEDIQAMQNKTYKRKLVK